ncbi:prolipoprotein diacylglyceryl transferase [Anaerovorax odorimutans]|uniref:Phosphatidylglycerol--prolipoprotein diacylglyceryl transferase n=1 Tax=Anaerovorax odorimutans TaxID=109327 RepID=A0ABT1RPS8_9FIRM|nr:prolipoprotein diacylglyceryl transferase [Anaerovorax odorimutans]MCQ4637205.1 prolipoprotein diacylglyceryl transferase [Anaerovorax odorimutans]
MPIPNPVAFTLFGIDVMWYGILIATGIVLATIITYRRAPRHGLESEKILDFVLICIPAGIIGARLYYVAFNWEQYSGDFLKIINTRLGGLAIHGGLIFGLGAAAILCIIWKIRPLNVMDLAIPSVALAQAIGRWGNYFNSEAHGGPTDLPWAVTVNGQTYHPTFLYESIWCLLLFFVLIYIDNRRQFEGQIFLLYGILYSVERFFVEGLRTDSLMIGPFKQAQVLSLSVIIVFIAIYVFLYNRWKKEKSKK